MRSQEHRLRPDVRWDARIALGLVVLTFLVRVVPAALFFGTSDVLAWDLLAHLLLAGQNFYATALHNWPALWIYFAAAAWLAHQASGLPFPLLVKLPPIGADACLSVLLYRTGLRLGWTPRAAGLIGVAYALQPISILVSGYHGQFDSLMIAPAFLAWYGWHFWHGGRRIIGSGLALGIGVWFKTLPLLLLPIMLLRLKTWRERLIYTALAVAPAAIGTLPYLLLWPNDVATNFLRYSSWYGQWGYPVVWLVVASLPSAFANAAPPDAWGVLQALWPLYLTNTWIVLAALVPTWWYTSRRGFSALHSILATFTVFYFTTSGFGLQYMVWVVPFALAARDRWLWAFTATATITMLVAYTMGDGAYLPPTIDWPPPWQEWHGLVALALTLPTWVISGLWAVSLLRRHPTQAQPTWSELTVPSPQAVPAG